MDVNCTGPTPFTVLLGSVLEVRRGSSGSVIIDFLSGFGSLLLIKDPVKIFT
jgi:hypothetical protein